MSRASPLVTVFGDRGSTNSSEPQAGGTSDWRHPVGNRLAPFVVTRVCPELGPELYKPLGYPHPTSHSRFTHSLPDSLHVLSPVQSGHISSPQLPRSSPSPRNLPHTIGPGPLIHIRRASVRLAPPFCLISTLDTSVARNPDTMNRVRQQLKNTQHAWRNEATWYLGYCAVS